MKKILCAAVAALTIGMCFTSCSKKAEEGYITMQSETCDFTFDYPESWTETYKDGMLSVTKIGDTSNANIVGFSFYHGLESVPTSMQYFDVYKAQLEETFKNVEMLEVKPMELGGQEQALALYTVTIGNEVFEKETLLIVYGEKVYTLTLTQGTKDGVKSDDYTDYSDEFMKCVKSFRIK